MPTFASVKAFSSIALSTAILMLLLHSLVPHQHHHADEAVAVEAERAGDWWDLLGQLFHWDLGQEHLEEFQKSNRLDWCPSLFDYAQLNGLFLCLSRPLLAPSQKACPLLPPPEEYPSPPRLAQGLRAPPSISALA